MDSLEPEDEEEIPIKRKKSRPLEESGDPGKKSEKLKRRQHVEKQSSEGALYILYAYHIFIENFPAAALRFET